MDNYGDDPVARGFDHTLALAAYGLLFMSVFTFWLPAVGAAAIAYSYRRGADWRLASHFRFQLTIFWGGFLLVALAVGMLIAAGGFAAGAMWAAATEAVSAAPAGATAGLFGLGALLAFVAAALWTLVASVWGAIRLATGRPIGQSAAGRALEPR